MSIFGTDGMRGYANQGNITPDVIMRLAMATSYYFKNSKARQLAIISKDTRVSSYMLENALTTGALAMGFDVILTGPLPTPAVAMLVRTMRADFGMMISASHNPYHDNGIKVFTADGNKLSSEQEQEIAELMHQDLSNNYAIDDRIGKATRLEDCRGRYMEHVKHSFDSKCRLDHLKIVVDCANGSGYKVAPKILWELGATVIPIGIHPNGTNINDHCGATDTREMRKAVVDSGADIGISLDGDADRLIICDENAANIDGDYLMAAITDYWHKEGILQGDGIAATIMSNMGLENFLHNNYNLKLYRTQVGDKNVVEMMRQHHLNLGGEQSGHIICGKHATTGDGLMSALQILGYMVKYNMRASEIGHLYDTVPQKMLSIPCQDKAVLKQDAVSKNINKINDEITSKGGRLLVRPSGTEPVIRIMAEHQDIAYVNDVLARTQKIINE
jgi:phosphoglucosamine mutase